MKNFRIIKKTLAVAIICMGLLTCKQSQAEPRADALVHAQIVGQDFYIPHAFLRFPNTSAGTNSVLLQEYYPGDVPVPGDPHQLWKQGEWFKNVRMLFSYVPKPLPAKFIDQQIDIYKAFAIVNSEYGLIHQTQPNGYVQDKDDVWINKGGPDPHSVIACTDEPVAPVPQCKQLFLIDHLLFTISYDKRLLPQWKTIQRHVVALFNSFKSPESASAYFKTVSETRQPLGEPP